MSAIPWVVILTADDGGQSVLGPFPSEIHADSYAADLELAERGAAQAMPLEHPWPASDR